jgi:hypothetical protein
MKNLASASNDERNNGEWRMENGELTMNFE